MTAALLSPSRIKNDLEQHDRLVDMFSCTKGYRYVPDARKNPVEMFRCMERAVDIFL